MASCSSERPMDRTMKSTSQMCCTNGAYDVRAESGSGLAEIFQRAQHRLLFGIELVRHVLEDRFRGFAVGGDALQALANDLVAIGHQFAGAVLGTRLRQLIDGGF